MTEENVDENRIDAVALQGALDEIASTVEWAAHYIEGLEANDDGNDGLSDRPGLLADAARLRVVADAIVPGRVIDRSTGRRWYLAPDEVGPRREALRRGLERATIASREAFARQAAARREGEAA
jgi:hypothetical protein